MKFLDFFAGIGGFRRGMELAGHECVGFCEIDKYAVMSYTSMHLITEEQRRVLGELPLKERQKEILKEEYRNGEWYADDITKLHAGDIPKADIWCFGSPCQSFSQAGSRTGLDGVSGLIGEIFRLLSETGEEDRPRYLISENVKGMLTSRKGFDFLRILMEMDKWGYDVEWQLLNSKWYVPQNRERVFTIGHLRGYSTPKVFPVERTDRADSLEVNQIGQMNREGRNNLNQYRVYDGGIAPTLTDMQGGGREPHTILKIEGGVRY